MSIPLWEASRRLTSPNPLLPLTLGGHLTEIAFSISMPNQSGVKDTTLARWSDLVKLARALLPPGDETRRTLENVPIWKGCEDLLLLFDPVCQALNEMQSATTTLSEAVEIWIELLQKAQKNAGGYEILVARSKQALECPFFLLANVLDPRFAGAKLSPPQVDVARQFAEEEGTEVALALNLYLSRSQPFRSTLFVEGLEPIAWWKAGQVSGFPKCLCQLALRLCASLSSTASLERIFSTMGHVYGRKRTNLGVEKAGKLSFLFRSLNPATSPSSEDSE